MCSIWEKRRHFGQTKLISMPDLAISSSGVLPCQKKQASMKRSITLALISFLMFAACDQSDDDDPSQFEETPYRERNATKDFAISDQYFQDADNQIILAWEAQADKPKRSNCPTSSLSATDGGFPATITVDFGEACTGADGRVRSGKLIATFSGAYRDKGTIYEVSFDGYSINGYALGGTKRIENLGEDAEGRLQFSVAISDGILKKEETELTYSSQRTRTWVEGQDTPWPNILDDAYLIEGMAQGVDRDGQAYTVTVTEPLLYKADCAWLVSGILTVSPDNRPLRTIDYGDGSCDNKVTFTVNDYSVDIEI